SRCAAVIGRRSERVMQEVKPMSRSRLLFLGGAIFALVSAAVACGDDDNAVVSGNDGGTSDTSVPDTGAGDGATNDSGSTCGLTLPAEYTSSAFETNAKTELDLRAAFSAFLKPMSDNEATVQSGDAGALLTKTQLE